MEKQKTIKEAVSLEGIGLHTGEKVRLTINPAPENHGYKFKRLDLENQPLVMADANKVVETKRGTTLEQNNARIYTPEHLLAALYSQGIDNVLIEMNGPEIPILDGSSSPFLEAIEKAGIVDQKSDKEYFSLNENISWKNPETGVEFLVIPADEFKVTVTVDYDSPALGMQKAEMLSLKEFKEDFSSCRTFVFLHELEKLAEEGLIKGGDIDNAVVLVDRENVTKEELDSLAKKIGKEHLELEYGGIGTLNNTKLKFDNEPARHKLLDVIGDLALVGKPIKAHVIATKPGHESNISLAKIMKAQLENQKKAGFQYDLNKEPLYDINDISKMLPHRYPFLLVDKIMEINENGIIGVKNVTMNEPFFQGHFPDNPVMPGVLQIEATAQVGGIFALSQVPDPELYTTYFMKIDKVKFKKKVIPGDTIIFKLELLTPIRRGIVHMGGKAYVNGEMAMEAEMMAQIVKDKVND